MGISADAGVRERLRSGQDGFTLVELLVTTLILGVVLAATLSVVETTYRLVPADVEWSHTLQDTQTRLYQMTRQLRQGTNIAVSSYQASADVVLDGQTRHLLWKCDVGGSCTRAMTTAPAAPPVPGAGGEVVIRNLQNVALGVPVFTSPATNYFQVQIKVLSTGSLPTPGRLSHTVTYTDGFFARNL